MGRVECESGESAPVAAEDISTSELARTIARLDAAVSGSLARIEGKLDRVTDDHERRLRVLERVDIEKLTADFDARLKEMSNANNSRLSTIEKWMWGLSGTGAGSGLFAVIMQLVDQASK